MKIIVTDQEGRKHALDAVEGWRVMEIIRDHGLPIKAECGGACACATCHVYVDAAWFSRLPPMGEEEEHMPADSFCLRENSRLSCQIIMDEALDGLAVTLAEDAKP